MRRQIFFTLLIVAATAYITIKYFKLLNLTGAHAGRIIMRNIPDDAAVVLEFTNEKSFYDIFADNTLLLSLIGNRQANELNTVKKAFGTGALYDLFNGSNIYLSVHPANGNDVALLLSAASAKEFDVNTLANLIQKPEKGMLVTPLKMEGKSGFTIFFADIKKRFFVINKATNIYYAGFSKELLSKALAYKPQNEKQAFLLLSDKQNTNSLANFYINYGQLTPLFDQLFKNKDSDLFKSIRLLPALAALNLNYKTNALMFNGYTNIKKDGPESYLNLFAVQKPVINNLKEIFPATTAYAMNMAVSDVHLFTEGLSKFHIKAGLKAEKEKLYSRIKTETGMSVGNEFNRLLGNEFAVITTRFEEKLAIISVRDGSRLRPVMINISTMQNDDEGQFNYNKLPFFLLGDAFNAFRKPYFRIMDNYLVLANSMQELNSYYDTYLSRKFLNKSRQYISFDDLLAERSNVSFLINFKNAQSILKSSLKNEFYTAYQENNLSWKNFYAASYQFAAADQNFYTNFCMMQNNADTTTIKKVLKTQH